jgi:phosphodiesterase/alkaline phosphatase D-like protein
LFIIPPEKGLPMKIAILAAAVALCCSAAVGQSPYGASPKPAASSHDHTIVNGPVAEFVSDSKATIGWETASAASAMAIRYGNDRDHLKQTATANPSADGRRHHATLEGLSPETPYYFQVMVNGEPLGGVGTFSTVASGAAPVKSRVTIPK